MSGLARIILFATCLTFALHSPSYCQKLIPDYVVSQIGGSLGTYSSGFGYHLLNEKVRLSAHCGLVHEGRATNLSVASVKVFYSPLTVTAWNRIKVSPLDVGVVASYLAGVSLTDRSATGEVNAIQHAWWHKGFAAHVALENSVTYQFKKEQIFKSMTAYIEVNTNERYFLEMIQERQRISVWEMIRFGTGVRLTF